MLVRLLSPHFNNDAPVHYRFLRRVYLGNRFWSECVENFRFKIIPHSPNNIRTRTPVSAIYDSLQLIVVVEKGVRFVKQQRGLIFFNRSEQGSSGDIGCRQRPKYQIQQQFQKQRFSASFFGALDNQDWADGRCADCVCVKDPEGNRLDLIGRQNDESTQNIGDFIEQGSAINLMGPRLRFRKTTTVFLVLILAPSGAYKELEPVSRYS